MYFGCNDVAAMQCLLDGGAIFGRGPMELAQQMSLSQGGMRMTEGELPDAAKERYRQCYELLLAHQLLLMLQNK